MRLDRIGSPRNPFPVGGTKLVVLSRLWAPATPMTVAPTGKAEDCSSAHGLSSGIVVLQNLSSEREGDPGPPVLLALALTLSDGRDFSAITVVGWEIFPPAVQGGVSEVVPVEERLKVPL